MDSKIRTVIIEDERKSLLTLQTLLERYCPEVEVIGAGRSVEEGIRVLESLKPDLAFLDIAMPDGDAFDLLSRINKVSFEIIFITAYNNFALKAFEFSALHYLLKPINYLDLQVAIQRYKKIRPEENIINRLEIMNQSLKKKYNKISLTTSEGLLFIEISDIIRIEASHNYSLFYLSNKECIVVTKSSNHFEEMLRDLNFVRIHNAHLINLRFVSKYNKGQGGSVILSDGTELGIARSRKSSFLETLRSYTLGMGNAG